MTKYIIYVLELEDLCYYVGMTSAAKGAKNRLQEHKDSNSGRAAKWCKLHKPISIAKVIKLRDGSYDRAIERENEVTLDHIKRYGAERVRGGIFCSLDNDKFNEQVKYLKESVRRHKKEKRSIKANDLKYGSVKPGDKFYNYNAETGDTWHKTVMETRMICPGFYEFFLVGTDGSLFNGSKQSNRWLEHWGYTLNERPK